jgi:hypothetical protein
MAPVDGAAPSPDYAKFHCFLYIKGCCFFIIVVNEPDVAV